MLVPSSSDTKTTELQSFAHLLKGYVGPGCLSLPWAVSQLGITGGVIATIILGIWSSYNCWSVVELKRYILRIQQEDGEDTTTTSYQQQQQQQEEETRSTTTILTYPDLGIWAHGKWFGDVITTCICIQQLAVCTVFLSFIGENLKVVLDLTFSELEIAHGVVVALSLPFVILLVLGFPHLKALAPVIMIATLTLFVGFGLLGIIIGQEWNDRPEDSTSNTSSLLTLPLALCAILYSFEGICLVVPVESSMLRPHNFGKVFVAAMTSTVLIFCLVSTICVLTFGEVTNGSITAFLLSKGDLEDGAKVWLLLTNTVVSISVLLTYPLQLFPCLELMGPSITNNLQTMFFKTQEGDGIFHRMPEDQTKTNNHNSSRQQQQTQYDTITLINDEQDTTTAAEKTCCTTPMEEVSKIPGDSVLLRLCLTLLTFVIAIIVPNVQVLISLAGALAGSSIALLIPPILELAQLRHANNTSNMLLRGKCYLSLVFGAAFLSIGTFASMKDIMEYYTHNE